eukprot:scaffold6345_cov155-Amphora_coffeaeformis.AAC.2
MYASSTAAADANAAPGDQETLTILGFGSLLSEKSARTTFPDLQHFRLGRLPGYRRVFAHPADIFFQRGIADLATKQMSSLSVEPFEGAACIVTVFEVPNKDMMEDGTPCRAFLEREAEFDIVPAPYYELDQDSPKYSPEPKEGIVCKRSTDEAFIQRWGKEHFKEAYGKYGIDTIWGWSEDSGLRPCAVYLRHCYLAAKGMGDNCLRSFLSDTFLVDRKTTVAEYLAQHPEVLETQPPPELAERYGG